MNERKKILWLVSWYPNRYDPFDGDFIQRHARAAALYDDIHVIFVKSYPAQKERQQEIRESDGLTEQIIYLPQKQGWMGKLLNYRNWRNTYRQAIGEYCRQGRPDLVHVHIPWKAGLLALWMQKKYHVPFVVTEHWGIYNRVVEDNIHTRPFLVRYGLRRIYRQANVFVSVSKYLGEGVNLTLVKKEFDVVPNVVNTALFYPADEKQQRFTFLHVSNMVPLKNVEGILEAFRRFIQQDGMAAQLVFIGNRDENYVRMAEELKLPQWSVMFLGEMAYAEVAREMRKAHVLVVNSHIENSPCVIGEALCCGLPVMATRVGGIPELVDRQNGLLVSPNDPESLLEAMQEMYRNYGAFFPREIARAAEARFSLPSVGQKLHAVYQKALERAAEGPSSTRT